jgi:hypothetical protein
MLRQPLLATVPILSNYSDFVNCDASTPLSRNGLLTVKWHTSSESCRSGRHVRSSYGGIFTSNPRSALSMLSPPEANLKQLLVTACLRGYEPTFRSLFT